MELAQEILQLWIPIEPIMAEDTDGTNGTCIIVSFSFSSFDGGSGLCIV